MAKKTVMIWTENKYATRVWPPGDPFKPDRDAARWRNSNRTTSRSLFNALCFFLTTGWPTEALDDFLEAIKPKAGWAEDWVGEGDQAWPNDHFIRPSTQNGPAVSNLFAGYWQPVQPPKGKKR